ncbi:hypothetical protein DT065_16625 [Salicibibacter kimchii]|uniref:Uncharacterized protein n=1 Tax=Salicibibacter kimchii TaxID=2099786 RepID=A0A345C2L8_9BACI|nr:hypothetical protein DT065_16625 [Salicibibacter kimchii]
MELGLGVNKKTILDYANVEFDERTNDLFFDKYCGHRRTFSYTTFPRISVKKHGCRFAGSIYIGFGQDTTRLSFIKGFYVLTLSFSNIRYLWIILSQLMQC